MATDTQAPKHSGAVLQTGWQATHLQAGGRARWYHFFYKQRQHLRRGIALPGRYLRGVIAPKIASLAVTPGIANICWGYGVCHPSTP